MFNFLLITHYNLLRINIYLKFFTLFCTYKVSGGEGELEREGEGGREGEKGMKGGGAGGESGSGRRWAVEAPGGRDLPPHL